jgi:hypothetical protein
MLKFRCGFCLQEKEEKEPRKFGFMAWTPTHMKHQKEEGRASFYICVECLEKHFTKTEIPLIPSEMVAVQPMNNPKLNFLYKYINKTKRKIKDK